MQTTGPTFWQAVTGTFVHNTSSSYHTSRDLPICAWRASPMNQNAHGVGYGFKFGSDLDHLQDKFQLKKGGDVTTLYFACKAPYHVDYPHRRNFGQFIC